MKRNITSIIYLVVIGIFFVSCAKDTGNYDYNTINKITFKDPSNVGKIFVRQGEALKLAPEISLNGNDDDLSFQWFVYLNSFSAEYVQDSTLISTTRNLDYTVSPDVFDLGEDYKLTYKVTNNKTGLSYFYFYQLTVSDVFTTGWLFLEDKSGNADLAMILKDGTVYRDIYSFRNSDHPIKNPKAFKISAWSISDAVGPDGKKYYLVGENDAIELDGTTMKKRFEYDYLFFSAPATKKPTLIDWGGTSGTTLGLLINNGNLHTNFVGGFPGAKKYGSQLPSPNNAYNYRLAPQFISGNAYGDTYSIIMYDVINKRFYDVVNDGLRRFDNAAQNTAIFDMNNVGLDLIKLDSSNRVEIRNAVMKDSQGKACLLQFRMHRTGEQPTITVGKQEINSPGIAQAADVTCSTLSPHLFYGANGKLYRYEVTSNTYSEEYAFGANETVTKIKFQKHGYGAAQPRLIVTTWDGTQGKVYYFKITQTGTVDSLDKVYDGFGKIIDLAFKY
ncbi:PKD-like family lipoprotein [Sphingobacterium psychroaquaticum]|uniref:PKD-like family protein n=1 Tax=Sphingobacterium psychroaquaticum TaxID=561061 RepID=A0A1X7HWK7_9SPHI|nr:PKD-like family lipoprotein [Sphingobacterium psychroaquaticum]SMG06213.1 PKD-like family protein [Sphingobacterium psychroaquaticum]